MEGSVDSIEEAAFRIKDEPSHVLDQAPWVNYPYKPRVSFKIAWAEGCLILQYRVREKTVKAEFSSLNDPVYRDSCVEFFISPDGESYFNLEINCIGTTYMARGTSRETSRPLNAEQTDSILCISSLGNTPFPERESVSPWELTVLLPLALFGGTPLKEPAGGTFRGNFYKCGDDLSEPHFLAWNDIRTESPDFHRPEFFGAISFQNKKPASLRKRVR